MRIIWNAPEGRFFDTGLDRGVLYPKKPPVIGAVTAHNLLTNPNFMDDTAGWSANNGSVTRIADGIGVSGAMKYTSTTPVAGGNNIYSHVVSVTPGQSVYVTSEVKMVGQPSDYMAVIYWYSNTTLLSSKTVTYPAASLSPSIFTEISALGSAPAGATGARLSVIPVSALSAGNGFVVRKMLLAKSEKPVAYFDGDLAADGSYLYGWDGSTIPNTSWRQERFTSAAAWNGLTSVDEEGGDGAAEYYVDGRPFLYLPRPKEFKATINAYTYPDAFSEIMGVAEITDGMYLDSQIGESFDLAYRTLVGNQLEGSDHGYKIHLVYNATVTPQSLTYESLSNSVNPTTFSWVIQAVPVRVDGFRPTAHIIIDTRHMAKDKIVAIEGMLYGDAANLARMPTPQEIFNILSFGDAIIVTDNGDGTFTVEGSYENVYMIAPGEFRVDNVDAVNHGDGTFTISSTGV